VIEDPGVRPGVTVVGAYAICLDAGRMLLVRIREDTPDDGRWTLPGGGIEFGESPDDAVVRELAEEAGLAGEIESLAGVHSFVRQRSIVGRGRPLHHLGFLYRLRVVGGELRDETDGTTDRAAWLSEAEIRSLPLVPLAETAVRLVFDPVLDGA